MLEYQKCITLNKLINKKIYWSLQIDTLVLYKKIQRLKNLRLKIIWDSLYGEKFITQFYNNEGFMISCLFKKKIQTKYQIVVSGNLLPQEKHYPHKTPEVNAFV